MHNRWLPLPLTFFLTVLLALSVVPGTLPGVPRAPAQAQTGERCFAETGYCIAGRIREFWEQNGGLPVFGLPITPQQAETIEGQQLQVQWFERNRLELHPENAPPYDVLLGRLGVDTLEQQGRDWWSFPRTETPQTNCRYFAETQQNVCGSILAAWRANGLELDGLPGKTDDESLALFGLPISPAQTERLSDGQDYTVQWFERARFEMHPENQPPFDVLLGLLGRAVQDGEPSTPPPQPTTPDWPAIQMEGPLTGFNRPTAITHAGDGTGRLFVVEQEGTIRVVQDGNVLPTPFLDITDRVGCCGERGLLSVAFPPGFASKQYFYIDYTNTNGDTKVARYNVSATNRNVADPTSEQVILQIGQPYANHNGGQLAFGPNDGYLYIGMGDGGSGGDPENRAQNVSDLLGKILRIDVESDESPYAIPSDNPLVGSGARQEIWALGLRNPWRFAFDRATGDLFISDVGQDAMEEINYQPADSTGGENYGWRIMEGTQCFGQEGCNTDGLTMPVLAYDHSSGRCSVTGGNIYRGSQYPAMQGVYFYTDYCSGELWGLRQRNGEWQNRLLYLADGSTPGPSVITTFGEDEDGTIYAGDYIQGAIWRITTP